MILNPTPSPTGNRATLDDLFRRAGVQRPDAMALVDPPDCERLTGRAPRRLTYADADRAISAVAARLRSFGLQTDAVVAVQLANTVDSIIALLGVLRAGMIPAPLPLLWRMQEIVNALSPIGPKAIITSARAGDHAQADIAMQVAAELFPIRYVCGFGKSLPDGVVPVDDSTDPIPAEFFQSTARTNAAAHVAAVTFDTGQDGFMPLARNHNELIAGGLAASLEAGVPRHATILSTIPAASFAGIAVTLVPWLLSGGTLVLHHGFDPAVFAQQVRENEPNVTVVPGPATVPLAEADLLSGAIKTILGLWRAPEQLGGAALWQSDATVVDIASFGEVGLLPARRGPDGRPAPLAYGVVAMPRGASDAVTIVETARNKTGTLTLRGAMVPSRCFPPHGDDKSDERFAPNGALDTGYVCKIVRQTGTLVLTAPPAGMTTTGFYRFRQSEVDAVVAAADPSAVIVALPDAQLGQRLAGRAGDNAALAMELDAYGVNALIAGAFRPRGIAA